VWEEQDGPPFELERRVVECAQLSRSTIRDGIFAPRECLDEDLLFRAEVIQHVSRTDPGALGDLEELDIREGTFADHGQCRFQNLLARLGASSGAWRFPLVPHAEGKGYVVGGISPAGTSFTDRRLRCVSATR
jgi:hypothetical protein